MSEDKAPNYLQHSLLAQRDQAWVMAHYEREQSDKLTSQIRFGLVAANAASLISIINLSGKIGGVPHSAEVLASIGFLIGTMAAGTSLISHQNSVTVKVGDLFARASALDRAVNQSMYPPTSPQFAKVSESTEAALNHFKDTLKISYAAISGQNIGMGAWIFGALSIAVPALAKAFPVISAWLGGC